MKMYYKISPILMVTGFALLALGVFMSMSHLQRYAYAFVGLGLILYIVGRIGIYFTPKMSKEFEESTEDKEENKVEI